MLNYKIMSLFIVLAASVSFAMPSSKILERAGHVTEETYPDAHEVLLNQVLDITYEADGTYEQVQEAYIKILTEEARRQFSTLSSFFTIPYQRGPEDCQIREVNIIKPDGTTIPIDLEKQSKIMVNPGSMSQNIYNPNSKVIRVNVAGLESGDILHYVMYDRIVHPRVKNAWHDWLTFEGTHPIIESRVTIKAPTNAPLLNIALKDPVEGSVTSAVTTNNNRIVYTWEARNIPRMFPEPNMPPQYTVVQRLLLSTEPDWESVSRWYWELSTPRLIPTPEIIEKVKELTDGLHNEMEIIQALFRFVSQEIRYMGIIKEAEAPGYEPHDVGITFQSRHGVCRDKAALLVAMLREAGLDAFPTLIHNGTKKDDEVPQPFFNHAVVAVRDASGHYILMDPTDENTKELFPSYLNNKSYLVATPEGDTLRTSPIDPPETNMMRIKTTGTVTDDGRLLAQTDLIFNGINDNAYRGWFARLKPVERRRYFEGLVRRAAPDAKIMALDIVPENMLDLSTNLHCTIRYEAGDILVGADSDKKQIIHLPRIGTKVGIANFILGNTGLRKRMYPFQTDIACGIQETVALMLPETWEQSVICPDATSNKTPGIEWETSWNAAGKMIKADSRFILSKVDYMPEEYLDLKETLATIEQDLRRHPLLSPPESDDEPEDSIILKNATHYKILTTNSWTETQSLSRKILTYAGKKKYAELKLHYNPVWESIHIVTATVTDTEGRVHSVSADEINEMDAPWAGEAPRYPAAKILVISFPAVEEGCMINYTIEWTKTGRPFIAITEGFATSERILEKTVTVHTPADIQLNWDIQKPDALDIHTSITNGMATTRLQAENVPPIQSEEKQAPTWSFTPVAMASGGSWPAYAQQLLGRFSKLEKENTVCHQKIKELQRSAQNNKQDLLKSIRDQIEKTVRTTGPGLNEIPLSILSGADTTLQDGYGNRADKAVLFYTMTKLAGFRPEYVLPSALPDISELITPFKQTAIPSFFSDPVVRIPAADVFPGASGWIYLNEGSHYDALGTLTDEDAMMYLLSENRFSMPAPFRTNHIHSIYIIDLEENGDAILEKQEYVYGSDFGAANKQYTEMSPEERRRHFQEMAATYDQDAEILGEPVADFSTYPGKIHVRASLPGYAAQIQNFLRMDAPIQLDSAFHLRSSRRKTPLYIPSSIDLDVLLDVRHPDTFLSSILPPSQNRTVGTSSLMFKAESTGMSETNAMIRYRLRIEPSYWEPGAYKELLDFSTQLSKPDCTSLLFEKRTEE